MPFSNSADPRESVKRRVVWFALFIISMGGLVVMTISGIRQRDYARCNAEQVAILIQYQREASFAAREERVSSDKIREAQLAGDRAAEVAALEEYLHVVRKQSDARRASAKLPDLPEDVCGKESRLP